MYTLSSFTCARLKRLPKQPTVWEGDRRSISEGMLDSFGYDNSAHPFEQEANDCILWVDGGEGAVRGVTIVPADTGPEAVVRTLLQAMEHPHGALSPARPQKIIVCNREIHFFLRGALQDIDVVVELAETLPVIDEIFEGLQQSEEFETSALPDSWLDSLNRQAHRMWDNGPWNHLSDDQILRIELNHWDLETLYVSVLGMAGKEYGLLLYRSLESLTQFRQAVTSKMLNTQQMQQAFLSQDCLFLNFELVCDQLETHPMPLPWLQSAPSSVIPQFGSLHPLEGLRTALELEEAAALSVCVEGLNQFFEHHEAVFSRSAFPSISTTFEVLNPINQTPLTLSIGTCPEVMEQFAAAETVAANQAAVPALRFRDDYVPEGSIILLTCLSQEMTSVLKAQPHYHAIAANPSAADRLPVVVIQTSRPKAKTLVAQLEAARGIQSVCFSPGRDPMTGDELKLGLLQTGDGDFHLFVEFLKHDPEDDQTLQQWQQWRELSQGRCGVVIASGSKGAAKGNPGLKETMALFEAYLKTPEELNLPPLQMQYALDWE